MIPIVGRDVLEVEEVLVRVDLRRRAAAELYLRMIQERIDIVGLREPSGKKTILDLLQGAVIRRTEAPQSRPPGTRDVDGCGTAQEARRRQTDRY